ncbi:hypothetical protein J8273_6483 [Carpediemonas membranifera]|uniref:Uncharacterized protein n=1 Tax=Carpediemonas membranifera TaxID=201153 RepID=A0A8J6B7M6_9EUKA|nr:hypothetical protein J8273_6483 [Carpediemonas membranifera]|eukprot:KAG9391707.1 hypothetical protein J8273_6483 [Carpediemonas membranifera]
MADEIDTEAALLLMLEPDETDSPPPSSPTFNRTPFRPARFNQTPMRSSEKKRLFHSPLARSERSTRIAPTVKCKLSLSDRLRELHESSQDDSPQEAPTEVAPATLADITSPLVHAVPKPSRREEACTNDRLSDYHQKVQAVVLRVKAIKEWRGVDPAYRGGSSVFIGDMGSLSPITTGELIEPTCN